MARQPESSPFDWEEIPTETENTIAAFVAHPRIRELQRHLFRAVTFYMQLLATVSIPATSAPPGGQTLTWTSMAVPLGRPNVTKTTGGRLLVDLLLKLLLRVYESYSREPASVIFIPTDSSPDDFPELSISESKRSNPRIIASWSDMDRVFFSTADHEMMAN